MLQEASSSQAETTMCSQPTIHKETQCTHTRQITNFASRAQLTKQVSKARKFTKTITNLFGVPTDGTLTEAHLRKFALQFPVEDGPSKVASGTDSTPSLASDSWVSRSAYREAKVFFRHVAIHGVPDSPNHSCGGIGASSDIQKPAMPPGVSRPKSPRFQCRSSGSPAFTTTQNLQAYLPELQGAAFRSVHRAEGAGFVRPSLMFMA